MIRAAVALALLVGTVVVAAPVIALGGGDEEPEKDKGAVVKEPEKDKGKTGDHAIRGPRRVAERVENLQEELDSLLEDVEDLWEPIEEFDVFDQCAYLIPVTEYGTRDGSGPGFYFNGFNGPRKSALALDMRGFGESQFQFLSFPGEEPPSIECNEDAEEEIIDR